MIIKQEVEESEAPVEAGLQQNCSQISSAHSLPSAHVTSQHLFLDPGFSSGIFSADT